MKTTLFLLMCITLCGCGVFQDKYKYTTMHKIHTQQHVVFNNHPLDCGWCTREKAEQAKSMLAEETVDSSSKTL